MDMMRKCRFKAFAFFEYSPEQRLSQPAPLLAITLQKTSAPHMTSVFGMGTVV